MMIRYFFYQNCGEAAAVILALDIGNTNLVFGVLEGGAVRAQARAAAGQMESAEEVRLALLDFFARAGIAPAEAEGGILSSVVPRLTQAAAEGAAQVLGRPPLIVGPELDLGLPVLSDDPKRVGTDRLVIAAGALAEYPPPLILADLGTATNIEAVDAHGAHVGGAIAPGVRTALDALTARAAQLPEISLDAPGPVIGRNTVDCMRSGALYGAAAMLDGMIDRIEAELGGRATALATGGLAPLVVPLCRREIRLEPDLMLKGLEVLYYRHHS